MEIHSGEDKVPIIKIHTCGSVLGMAFIILQLLFCNRTERNA